ncbi:MAG TPA: VanZ family protein [Xanthobacteraceae bacterium]|nr:VanZ family protein [Xanthobacteraceae bacterium]
MNDHMNCMHNQPQDADHTFTYLRAFAWLSLAAIIALTIVPPRWRPITPLPHALEHGIAFVITAAAFGACYAGYQWRLFMVAPAFCAVIELSQFFVPGRHARLSDFCIDAAASLIGLLLGSAVRRKDTPLAAVSTAIVVGVTVVLANSIPFSALGQIERLPVAPNTPGQAEAITEAIRQNTRQINPPHPAGVPPYYRWYGGKSGRGTAASAPKGFSAISGWGVIYPEAGFSDSSAGGEVMVADFLTYLHLTDGGWLSVQSQVKDAVHGGTFAADFSNNANVTLSMSTLPDGSTKIATPGTGFTDHFWPATRGSFSPGTIDGVLVTAKLKTAGAHLIAALGADWWRNSSAGFKPGFANNPGVGQSNFVELTPQWQTLYFYSLTAQQLQSDPPPLAAPTARP